VWHFQAVHHGLWDHDFRPTWSSAALTVDGRRVKAVMVTGKQAVTYVFEIGFNTGDSLAIAVGGGTVKNSKNGSVFYASAAAPARRSP